MKAIFHYIKICINTKLNVFLCFNAVCIGYLYTVITQRLTYPFARLILHALLLNETLIINCQKS